MSKEIFDIAIIGAGPGGYVAAIRASQLGLRVCLIEKEASGVGGTCLNRGCIPTKILASGADLIENIKSARRFGIRTGEVSIDYKSLKRHKDKVVKDLRQGVAFLLKKNRVIMKYGFGRLIDKNSIEIEREDGAEKVLAKHIILATGSDPAEFPGMDGKKIIDTTAALNREELPKSMIIVGGSVSGCEFASIYNSFGVEITIIEIMDTILNIPNSENEIVEALSLSFKKKGINIVTSATITSVEPEADMVNVDFQQGGEKKSMKADMVLVTAGRKLLTNDLNLQSVGIEVGSQGEVITDRDYCTGCGSIYAIGDITGKHMLAHSAYGQAKVVCSEIAGHKSSLNLNTIPYCIFTHPPLSMVGLNEQEALRKGYKVKTGIFPFENLGIAKSLEKTEGFVKIVSDHKGCILSGHMIGSHAIDLIQEICLAINKRLTVRDLTNTIHPHPTFSEAVLEAGEHLFEEAIHI